MIFVKVEDLKYGMRLAKPIYNKSGVLLYERNTRLSLQGIESVNGTIFLLFESGASKYRSGGGKNPVDTLFKAELTRY